MEAGQAPVPNVQQMLDQVLNGISVSCHTSPTITKRLILIALANENVLHGRLYLHAGYTILVWVVLGACVYGEIVQEEEG